MNRWQKNEDVTDIEAWAEVTNNHIDTVISDCKDGMFYYTLNLQTMKPRSYVIWDKNKKIAYEIFDDNSVFSPRFENYALTQWLRFMSR